MLLGFPPPSDENTQDDQLLRRKIWFCLIVSEVSIHGHVALSVVTQSIRAEACVSGDSLSLGGWDLRGKKVSESQYSLQGHTSMA